RRVSCGDLPHRRLRLISHPAHLHRRLGKEPGPEWKGHIGQRAVRDVLARVGVLVHLGPHVPRIDADDRDIAILELGRERLRYEFQGGGGRGGGRHGRREGGASEFARRGGGIGGGGAGGGEGGGVPPGAGALWSSRSIRPYRLPAPSSRSRPPGTQKSTRLTSTHVP